jgi:hypothetical protein
MEKSEQDQREAPKNVGVEDIAKLLEARKQGREAVRAALRTIWSKSGPPTEDR